MIGNLLISAALFVLGPIGCAYTLLQRTSSLKDPHEERSDEKQAGQEQRRLSLCATWRGVVITDENGIVGSVDTVYALTLKSDSTCLLRNKRGEFQGQWTFSDRKPSFYLSIHFSSPEQESSLYFLGYVRDWGLQLYESGVRPHMIDVTWNLRQ